MSESLLHEVLEVVLAQVTDPYGKVPHIHLWARVSMGNFDIHDFMPESKQLARQTAPLLNKFRVIKSKFEFSDKHSYLVVVVGVLLIF